MAIAKKLLTAEEFAWLLPSRHAELIDGEIVPLIPTSYEHGQVVMRLGRFIGNWLGDESPDYLGTETGLIVQGNPDRTRAPDVLYVTAQKMASRPDPDHPYLEVQPDLVAEVVSPGESAEEVQLKLRDYLAIGTRVVVLIYPITQEVVAHMPDGSARLYREEDVLEFSQVLPGFRLEVARLFKI